MPQTGSAGEARLMTMTEPGETPPFGPGHTTPMRLQTLILLRWVAVAGQLGAVAVAHYLFSVETDLGPYSAVIGLSVLANVVFMFVFPANKRLRETEAMAMLLFDSVQLALLLYISGGLNNPFSVLIIAPVTVAATALSSRATFILGAVVISLATLLTFVHLPLIAQDGTLLTQPRLFLLGLWAAVVITTVFLAAYTHRISGEMRDMSQALLATQMALAREQKLTDLGGIVAAAAHELGTPLATIMLTATEVEDELTGCPEQLEDIRLIRQQAARCRDILHEMGRTGKDDMHMRQAPLSAIVDEAAEPHLERGIEISI
ncbi:MAG TPA: ActS/PrrB/RegB family redox-sensitive histidine kinase, partial [Aliiroseovarius sp.]|nr:ActS/PrrB/RegB family redox-sensitive histidine kinase [Aliiroseovarius sp.]